MSITLDIGPTRAALVTARELSDRWGVEHADLKLTVARLRSGVREYPPAEQPLSVDASYVIEFSDGIEVSLLISDNVSSGCDEEGEVSEFGDPSHHSEFIARWRAVGHTYVVILSGGAYGKPFIHRMEQVAGVIAGLVQGHVMVLDPWYSRPRGLYGPGTFP